MQNIEEEALMSEEWKIEIQCEGNDERIDEMVEPCGRKFEVSEKNLHVKKDEYDDEVLGAVCPECGAFTLVETRDIPDYIERRCRIRYKKQLDALKEQKRKNRWKWVFQLFHK